MNKGTKQKQFIQKKTLSCKQQSQFNQCIALDCEMVGIGIGGKTHMVARVSIVNQEGEILIDKFVKPKHPVSVQFISIYKIFIVFLIF